MPVITFWYKTIWKTSIIQIIEILHEKESRNFVESLFIHATHQECPFNCLGDELITIYFSNVESSKHFVLTTFKGVKDMEEEISVQLDLMIIIPMTVNDPI